MARRRGPSRAQRWADAVSAAQAAISALDGPKADLASALSDLRDVQGEYESWKDNLPEGLVSSPVGEKLEQVVGIDLDPDEDDVAAMIAAVEEAEGADLPLGWGKD